MPSKVRRGYESLITDATAERFLASVGALMRLQGSKLCEALGAVLTFVGSLSRMFVHVCLEIAVLSERLGA